MFIPRAVLSAPLFLLALVAPAAAQSSTVPSTASVTVIQTSTNVPITSSTRSGNQDLQFTTAAQSALNITSTFTPTSASASSASASASLASSSASATPTPITLATKLDPAFGVLGALLILTGLPSAFFGHKNRWTSFFLIGFYTLSLVCIVLILRFGVLDAVHPPSATLRGMFVLASAVAGVAGGGVAIFFWKATKYFVGAWGGFAFALWIQCFRNGGLIRSIGIRWILFIGCAVIGFVLCTIPKVHYHVVLVSTALVGASAIMLGVDCFTTADLKEFYIWNLGFTSLFPKFKNNGMQFPVSQTMEIELGLTGAIAIMGAAVQFRVLHVLQRKLKEIAEEQKRREAQDDAKAGERFLNIDEEKAEWDREHPTLGKHSRGTSEFSGTPLMKDTDGFSTTPNPEDGGFAARQRRPSGLSEFMVATPIEEEDRRGFRTSQLPGALPALDLGNDIQGDVPQGFISEDTKKLDNLSPAELDDLKRKEGLLAEIQSIRRSIDVLKAETPSNSTESRSRQPSFTSRRTLSYDLNTAILPEVAHARPERQRDPRARVQSMDMSRLAPSAGPSIGRPTSAPLRDEDWDSYVRERKLLQPPAGVTSPIPTTSIPQLRTPSPRLAMSPAVQDALLRRQQRESMLGLGDVTPNVVRPDSPGLGLAAPAPKRQSSYIPPTILPPVHRSPAPTPAASPRTVTYEELTERHREKMRQLQAPTTREQTERAEVENARARWERSKAVERAEVERRQAERAKEIQRDRQRKSDERNHPSTGSRHSRTLSGDRFAGLGGTHTSSKRVSTMKVEDWQRYQTDVASPEPSSTRRRSGVPFPDGGHPAGHERGPSQRMSSLPSPRGPPT